MTSLSSIAFLNSEIIFSSITCSLTLLSSIFKLIVIINSVTKLTEKSSADETAEEDEEADRFILFYFFNFVVSLAAMITALNNV